MHPEESTRATKKKLDKSSPAVTNMESSEPARPRAVSSASKQVVAALIDQAIERATAAALAAGLHALVPGV